MVRIIHIYCTNSFHDWLIIAIGMSSFSLAKINADTFVSEKQSRNTFIVKLILVNDKK